MNQHLRVGPGKWTVLFCLGRVLVKVIVIEGLVPETVARGLSGVELAGGHTLLDLPVDSFVLAILQSPPKHPAVSILVKSHHRPVLPSTIDQ